MKFNDPAAHLDPRHNFTGMKGLRELVVKESLLDRRYVLAKLPPGVPSRIIPDRLSMHLRPLPVLGSDR
jgi:hypothetical protein